MADQPLIAVVNNDTAFLELMNELLSDAGYRTIIHKEGDSAYQRILKEQPALVILDIRMDSAETGWQVLEVLRLDPKTARIPIIVCSADTQRLRDKADLLRRLRCATLEKPFNIDDLLALVAQFIGQRAD